MLRARRLIHLSLAALTMALALAAVALAATLNGGDSIASAPNLPLDQTTASGWTLSTGLDNVNSYGEFWRLQMNAGDRVILDLANTQASCSGAAPSINILTPAVTDFTLSKAPWAFNDDSNGASKYESVWAAPSAGRWTLFFSDCQSHAFTFLARV